MAEPIVVVPETNQDDTGFTTHPEFSDADADVILVSKDNTQFFLYSVVLRITSGWFRVMFTLPQNPSEISAINKHRIQLDESADVLAAILQMVSGIGVPAIDTIEFAGTLLNAAEKYDMPGPPAIIRRIITQPPFIDKPLRVYALTVHWGWKEEMQTAISHCLSIDLCDPDVLAQLEGTNLSAVAFAPLVSLQRSRHILLQKKFNNSTDFVANSNPVCRVCSAANSHEAWNAFKSAYLSCTKPPLTESSLTIREIARPGVLDVLVATCTSCGSLLYNPAATIDLIVSIISELPKTFETQK
ncbi:hypothetical protein QCA50_013165 [Cerrena zonata]|uniref:BTB domain-containing protein n=1 Tax=Cerrena zonata TaxID=2478898 RepID=A0AAW0FWK2_9APHY